MSWIILTFTGGPGGWSGELGLAEDRKTVGKPKSSTSIAAIVFILEMPSEHL
jgi:hypothetical protein